MKQWLIDSRMAHVLFVAVPFVVVAVGTAGLQNVFSTFQVWGDEPVHYQIVQQVAEMWPRPLLSGYASWSGPFVYWLLATLSRPLGTSLPAVRFAVMLTSWATCAVVYVILRDRLGARPQLALALALMLGLSPFFFGESFRVLTDNPAWLFTVLALERLLAYAGEPRLGRLAWFAIFAAASTLTRQYGAWLFLPGLVVIASLPVSRRQRIGALTVVGLGLVPLVALFVHWGGPVAQGLSVLPPSSLALRLRNVVATLAVVGLWGALVVPLAEIRAVPGRLGWCGWLVLGAAVTASIGALLFRALGNVAGGDVIGIGIVGNLSDAASGPAGISLSWWLLVPLGTAVVVVFAMTRLGTITDRLLVTGLFGVILSAAGNGAWYQRYVDFPVLLLLTLLTVASGCALDRVDRLRLVGVVAISLLWATMYALIFVLHIA
jgi:hypothetical protein